MADLTDVRIAEFENVMLERVEAITACQYGQAMRRVLQSYDDDNAAGAAVPTPTPPPADGAAKGGRQ